MTHKSPFAWPPQPARVPRRTALIGSLPVRVQVQRALKLAGMASIWITGLFVVIAAVAAVAMTTTPASHSRAERASYMGGHAGTGSQHRTGQPGKKGQHSGARARTGRQAAPTTVRDVYSGRGSAYTTAFTVGAAGLWKVSWSYACTGSAGQSGFAITQVDRTGQGAPAGAALALTRTGRSGHGVASAHRDPGAHALEIRTPCSWKVTVTASR